MQKRPIANPRKQLPASPMKILAGGKFRTRNPAAAAVSNMGGIQSTRPLFKYDKHAPAKQTVMVSTEAMPSMPSIKLNKFRDHTKPTTARTLPSKPKSTTESPNSIGAKPLTAHSAQAAVAK